MHGAGAAWSRLFLPGAGDDPRRSELESAPGPRPSGAGAGAAKKSGGSATLAVSDLGGCCYNIMWKKNPFTCLEYVDCPRTWLFCRCYGGWGRISMLPLAFYIFDLVHVRVEWFIFLIWQKTALNQRSGMILEVYIQIFGARAVHLIILYRWTSFSALFELQKSQGWALRSFPFGTLHSFPF